VCIVSTRYTTERIMFVPRKTLPPFSRSFLEQYWSSLSSTDQTLSFVSLLLHFENMYLAKLRATYSKITNADTESLTDTKTARDS
jgi:hypothetical protein